MHEVPERHRAVRVGGVVSVGDQLRFRTRFTSCGLKVHVVTLNIQREVFRRRHLVLMLLEMSVHPSIICYLRCLSRIQIPNTMTIILKDTNTTNIKQANKPPVHPP